MRLLTVALGFALWAFLPLPSEGCGDKFLRVGRGARFQRGYVALHPARIVLLARPGTPAGRALVELEPALRRAGHQTVLVRDPASLDGALGAGSTDMVMVEMGDVRAVEAHLGAAAGRPALLPVLHEATRVAVRSAEKEFGCVVESPGKKGEVLAEIDGLMEHRVKEGRVPAPARR